MQRKDFLRVAGLAGLATATDGLTGLVHAAVQTSSERSPGPARGSAQSKGPAGYVPAGSDRFGQRMMIWGAIPLHIKVSSRDSNDALFVFEHADMGKGGPPRHFHYEQDEWFYSIKGEFAFEVGDERFTLRSGDSLFAPRMVPHAWAHIGDQPGTLLLAVQPAGSLETFFRRSSEMTRLPTPEEAERLFAAHGMRVVGPPLDIASAAGGGKAINLPPSGTSRRPAAG